MFLTSILEFSHVIHMYSGPPFVSLIFGSCILTLPIIIISQAKKNYDSDKNFQHDIQYTFQDENMSVETFSSSSILQWNNIIKAEEIGGYLFLLTGKTNAYIIKVNQLSKEQLEFIKSKTKTN